MGEREGKKAHPAALSLSLCLSLVSLSLSYLLLQDVILPPPHLLAHVAQGLQGGGAQGRGRRGRAGRGRRRHGRQQGGHQFRPRPGGQVGGSHLGDDQGGRLGGGGDLGKKGPMTRWGERERERERSRGGDGLDGRWWSKREARRAGVFSFFLPLPHLRPQRAQQQAPHFRLDPAVQGQPLGGELGLLRERERERKRGCA